MSQLPAPVTSIAIDGKALKVPTKKPRKPAPSLTAQLKTAKAELKSIKAALVAALDNLELSRQLHADLMRETQPALTVEWMVASIHKYRAAAHFDEVTDGLFRRLVARLENLK